MRSPTNYYGGKARLAPWIVSFLPPHRTYVEPFSGSAAVLFAKPKALTEVLNDLDGQVVNFFRVLRDQPEDLERACRLTPYARAEYEACEDLEVGDPVERARRWWVRTNQSIGKHPGSTRGSGWAAAPNTGGADHTRKLISLTDRMAAAAARLRNVYLESRPAIEVIAKYASRPDVAVYYDPPYLASTRTLDRRVPRDYQQDMHTDVDHRGLADALHVTPAAVLLSGYPSPLYDELYADWWRLQVTVDSPTRNGHGRPMAKAVEVIWSNRPLAEQATLQFAEASV